MGEMEEGTGGVGVRVRGAQCGRNGSYKVEGITWEWRAGMGDVSIVGRHDARKRSSRSTT